MARASIPTEAASELYLIPGEAPDTPRSGRRAPVDHPLPRAGGLLRTSPQKDASGDRGEWIRQPPRRRRRRETELPAFLARRPGQFYSATELLNLAWGSPELSTEQLRTYVVRLRRQLATAGVPCRILSETRRGYGLMFTA